jgi:glycosyltransferase involved in cell wall biosynthesis
MERSSVVHTVSSIDPETGGPARSVTALCRALEHDGLDVTLVTQRPREPVLPFAVPTGVRFTRRGQVRGVSAFRRAVDAALITTPRALLHDHGIWLPTNHAVATLARRRRVPRVVSPRGMLDGWALHWHGWRKRLAWRLYQRRDVVRADLLHATSEAEAEDLRRLGLRQPIAVLPNGVETMVPRADVSPSAASEARVALFLSRVHPKKGLLHLVAAWAALRPPGWVLWIAGPDEGGHEADVRAAVRAALPGAHAETVAFLGPVSDARRAELMSQAELFVLPTLSENFGQVVAEALVAGLPVVTTKAAPWPALVPERAGWWVDVGTEALLAALREACALSAADLGAMGARGRAWAEPRFAWPAIAHRMRAVYGWLLHGGTPPPDVRLASAA